MVFIDEDERELFPSGAERPRKLFTAVFFESMILTCAGMPVNKNCVKERKEYGESLLIWKEINRQSNFSAAQYCPDLLDVIHVMRGHVTA